MRVAPESALPHRLADTAPVLHRVPACSNHRGRVSAAAEARPCIVSGGETIQERRVSAVRVSAMNTVHAMASSTRMTAVADGSRPRL